MLKHEVKEELYQITDLETGVTGRDVASGDNRDEWQDLWRYQVPTGISYVFKPEHHFSVYAEYVQDAVDLGLADDGGSFTDDTTDVNDAVADDFDLLPATEAVSDAFYFGQRYIFGRLRLNIGTAGVGAGSTVAWEYWDGSAWTAIPGLTDGTTNLLATAGTNNVNFTPPGDWARTTVNGKDAYWIRLRCTTANYTTQPLGTQAWINGGSMALQTRDRMRVVLRDASEETQIQVLRDHNYSQLTEFTDINKKARLDLGRPQVVQQGWWIVVQVMPGAGIVDASNGCFALECNRVRQGIS